jgi:hypothetical protein
MRADLVAALDARDPEGTGTMQQRIARKLVADAAAGNPFACKALFHLAISLDNGEADADDPAATDLEQKLIADFTSRLQSPDSDAAKGGSDV